MFSSEFCKIFKNIFFLRTPPVAAFMASLVLKRVFVFSGPRLRPPNLYLPALAPNLYLSALASNLYLPVLAPNLYLQALAPNLYLPALAPNVC